MDILAIYKKTKRIVVKVGTASITENLALNDKKVGKIVDEIVKLRNDGKEVIIVTSGSIGAGIMKLGLKHRPRDMNMLQAAAAVGQNELMKSYGRLFSKYGLNVGQILLTKDDFKSRKRYINIRNTVNTLIRSNVIPIINENDSVAFDEIKFGDNDTLSALVASNLEADLLILMSSMDGLFNRDPYRSKNAEKIGVVHNISTEIESLNGRSRGGGVGGIQSKIKAAKMLMRCGIPAVIVNSHMKNILQRVINGDPVGTVFIPKNKIENKLQWMLYASKPKGKILVDLGAAKIIKGGKSSLLPSGIVKIEGTFKRGDPVSIYSMDEEDIGKGITNYSNTELDSIKGLQTKDVRNLLGANAKKEVIYSENLAIVADN